MKFSSLLVPLMLACAVNAPAIDLTPSFITTEVDGIPIRRPCFRDGDKRYAVTIDAETELTAYEDSAIFNFTKIPRAVMRLRPSPLKVEVSFQGDGLAQYREAAQRLLVNGALKTLLEKEDANVFPVNHWTSQRFTFTYEFTGVQMRESVTFLNLDERQQVVVQIRSRESDFALISARAEDIIRRWHEVKPDEDKVGN